MPNLSGLKARIASTQDIGKITNAMQLVASSKLRKVGKKVAETQDYVSQVYAVFNDIVKHADHSPYLKENADGIKKTLWVVVNSNLGLCGGYNANVNRMVLHQLKPNDAIYAVGSKAMSFYGARHIDIKNQFLSVDIDFTSDQASQIGRDVMGYYASGEFDEIKLAYTKFINNVTFEPTTLRLFPIVKDDKSLENAEQPQGPTSVAEFDPDPETVLDKSVNMYLNAVLFGTIMESQVSEQASRRTAMENATDNGNEMIDKLHIKYNRERQAAITQEISEIVGGANALKDDN